MPARRERRFRKGSAFAGSGLAGFGFAPWIVVSGNSAAQANHFTITAEDRAATLDQPRRVLLLLSLVKGIPTNPVCLGLC